MKEPEKRKIKRPLVVHGPSFRYGVEIAAEVAADYDKTNSHPCLVSDCILAKLNVLVGKPRKNPDAESVQAMLARIERKLDKFEELSRFMTRHTNFKRSTYMRL